ncbi:MAG: hypothetical protein HQ518_14355 [Rhodopirellula sp.]|nr:hypothetical protein [Rhodopirellula sp.]
MSTLENPPANDQEMIDAIVDFQINLMKQTDPSYRGQHPKMHGCVRGEFRVLDCLDTADAVGIFAKPCCYPVWIRFSNGFSQDDRAPDFHGMAIKLMGVPGQKLGAEKQTQDFLLIDSPYFFAADVERLWRFMLQKVQFTVQGMSPPDQMKALSVDFPAEVARFLKTVSPAPAPPICARYWSCVPYLLGDQAVKYMVQPRGFVERAAPVDLSVCSQDYAGESLTESLSSCASPFILDFHVQRQTCPEDEPVEDASVEWKTPFTRIAELTIPAHEFNTAAQNTFGENLSFNPWHSLPEHRPLGGLNRSRKVAYEKSSLLRHETRGVPMVEPRPDDTPESILKSNAKQ